MPNAVSARRQAAAAPPRHVGAHDGVVGVKPGRAGRYQEIDVLRGLAALCVLLAHYTSFEARYFGATFSIDLQYGTYAVELFFIISGFVIFFTIERCESWREFAVLRCTRLLPTYWTALTLMVVIEAVLFGEKIWWHGYLANMTMLQEFLGIKDLDDVYWSLAVEIAFYLDMAVLFSLGALRRPELVGAFWLGAALLWPGVDTPIVLMLPWFLRPFVLSWAPFFVIGMMLYLISSQAVTRPRVAIIAAAIAVEAWTHGAVDGAVALVLTGIVAAALTGWLRLLVSPATLWLGAISYPLYVSHRNIGYFTLRYLHQIGWSNIGALLVTIPAVLILATLLSSLVERPAIRALRQFYRRRGVPAAQHS